MKCTYSTGENGSKEYQQFSSNPWENQRLSSKWKSVNLLLHWLCGGDRNCQRRPGPHPERHIHGSEGAHERPDASHCCSAAAIPHCSDACESRRSRYGEFLRMVALSRVSERSPGLGRGAEGNSRCWKNRRHLEI